MRAPRFYDRKSHLSPLSSSNQLTAVAHHCQVSSMFWSRDCMTSIWVKAIFASSVFDVLSLVGGRRRYSRLLPANCRLLWGGQCYIIWASSSVKLIKPQLVLYLDCFKESKRGGVVPPTNPILPATPNLIERAVFLTCKGLTTAASLFCTW